MNQIIARHGIPLKVHIDQGKNFESNLFRKLMDFFRIKKTKTTALHSQSNGQVERQHQPVTNYLSKYNAEEQRDWSRWILMFLLAHRSLKHEVTGVTPQSFILHEILDYL